MMMKTALGLPKVTVCVPVHNGARTIARTLESILAQDYANCEIIVSDNCSTDETAKIVREYAGRGVRYCFNSQTEGGAENNWNYVLSLASGPLIALYHADDIYTPAMVRHQAEFFKVHPEASAVFTMTQTISEQDRPIRMGSIRLPGELQGRVCFKFSEYFNALLKYGTFTLVPTMMTRREVLDKTGSFCWKKFASASDIDLYLRMAKQFGPIGIIDEPLHKYRISGSQGSAVIMRGRTNLPDFYTVIDEHLNEPEGRRIAEPKSLACYNMYRAADGALCAQNLLVMGKAPEARERLRGAMAFRHFIMAVNHPKTFVRLLMGLGLLVGINLGVGTFMGRKLSRAYERRNVWLRKPIK